MWGGGGGGDVEVGVRWGGGVRVRPWERARKTQRTKCPGTNPINK